MFQASLESTFQHESIRLPEDTTEHNAVSRAIAWASQQYGSLHANVLVVSHITEGCGLNGGTGPSVTRVSWPQSSDVVRLAQVSERLFFESVRSAAEMAFA